jgi:uncharacterized protein DUF397
MNAAELAWFKSSYSSSDGDSCVEVATSHPTHVHVRDSKSPDRPHLTVSPATWTAFISRTITDH